MNITYKLNKVKKNNWLNIAFDVSKDDLYMYTETGEETISCIADSFANKTDIILEKLDFINQTATSEGYSGIHIICEPSGGYESKLMNLSVKQGHAASYVSGEASNKFKMVEDNSDEKSDPRDARVIFKLCRYGKFLKYRNLDEQYAQLRHFNRMQEQEQDLRNIARGHLHHEIKILFSEQDWKEAFWYGSSGRALLTYYQANPYKIVQVGERRFYRRMKKMVKGIRNATLERIWSNVCLSVQLGHPLEISDLTANRIKQLWQDFQLHDQRINEIKQQMADIYRALLDQGEELPPVIKGFVSIENLARIVGETGPFSDFRSAKQIKRYAGMNIRIRESGQFKGQRKMSKKGRPRLRLILGQSIFHLIKKDRILGSYYHGLKERGMNGTKAMSVVSRKLVDVLFVLSRPGVVFDKGRLFVSESKYKQAA
ncbi:MAG: IS110 family transposase [Calditrichaeota bacterium]|nr:IS110 family transposase [Calditrichota bacterium]NOG47997.1 transposase [Calditrichota bacterium]